jgi:hypothetical protein
LHQSLLPYTKHKCIGRRQTDTKIQDSQESIVLTFWGNKEDMDAFYHPDSKVLSDLVDKLKPSFEQPPERKDYEVIKFKL